jgi:hypothetical protein
MILSLTHLAINGMHCHMLPMKMYKSALWQITQQQRLLPHLKNERQWKINDFWDPVLKHAIADAVTVSNN